jgi:tetratricopeptide (TPR) repeat protein
MKDLLCGLFSTLALWLYIRHASVDACEPRNASLRLSLYLLATLAFVLALLTKPVAVVVPVVAIVLDRGLLRRSWPTVIAMMAPWIVLAIPVALVTLQVQPAVDVAATSPPQVRPLIAGDALAFYLRQVIAPEQLALDYGRAPDVVARQPWRWLAWLVPVALVVLLWRVRDRARPAVVGAMLFVIPLLPVLGFVPFSAQEYSTVADHYLYLSMVGVALVAAWGASRVSTRTALLIALPVLLALATRSWFQTWHWRDTCALFTHNLTVNPRSWTSRVNLAADALLRGDGASAEQHARAAQSLRPDDPQIYQNLALALQLQGKQQAARDAIAEAVTRLEALVARQPNRPDLRHHLARARMIRRTLSAPTPTTTSTRPGL